MKALYSILFALIISSTVIAQDNKCMPYNNTNTLKYYVLNNKQDNRVLKSIIGYRKHYNEKYDLEDQDSVIVILFDKNANIIEYSERYYYISVMYKYDSLNRVTEKEGLYGESSGNGITYYKYSENKMISDEELGFYKNTDNFIDEKCNIIKSTETYIGPNNSEAYILTKEMKYNKSFLPKEENINIIISDTAIRNYDWWKQNLKQRRDFILKTRERERNFTIKYQYNRHNQLLQKVYIYNKTKDTTNYEKYVYDKNKKISESEISGNNDMTYDSDYENRTRNLYYYDKNNKLYSQNAYKYNFKTNEYDIIEEVEYLSDNEGDKKITSHYYTSYKTGEILFSHKEKLLYVEGKLIKQELFDKDNKLNESDTFSYSYW